MRSRLLLFVARASFACTLAASSLHAVAPNLIATAANPVGGQRGTKVDVTFRGERLADAQEILFYRPGITVEKLIETTDRQVRATLVIAPDCPLGEHPLRVRTAGGVSPLRLFYVGPFPTVEEKEPNNSAAKPHVVKLNTTIHGTLATEDTDFFRIDAEKGQRVSIEVEGARLGRTMFDPQFSVRDAAGQVVAKSDDSALLGHDGFASFIVPADGAYTIQLRDVGYTPATHFYRLHVGTFPRPAAVFPLGGQPGETITARFIGDVSGEFTQSVTLPREPVAKFGVEPEHEGIAPSPNWLRVVPLPSVTATTGATAAQAVALDRAAPFAFDGVLATKGEPAFFKFKAKKDQNLNIEVFARRLGSPIDSVLTVLGPTGNSLGSNDDASGNPDSLVRVKIPADGEYTVKVADQLARGGPGFTYRVEVSEVAPSLVLSIPDTARYDYETRKSIVVPRGNRFAVLLNLTRDLCNDDLAVAFNGLPAGVTLHADTVAGSVSAVPVVFEAAAEAPIAGTLLTPSATPANPEKAKPVTSRFRHTVEWVRIQNDTVYVKSEVNQIAAAVVDEVPFRVSIVEPKVPIVQGGEMNLEIRAERAEGFEEPITVKMLWNPPGVSSLPDMVIPKGADHVSYKLNATGKAEARAWKIAVVASATVKGGAAYVSSQLADLEVAPAFLFGKIDLTKVERGQSAKLTCTLEQKTPFEGTAIARLVGLPDTVTAKDVEITKDSTAAVFELVTTDKSPVGLTKTVACNVIITRNGEPITQAIATGSLLRIDPPKQRPSVAASAAASPSIAAKPAPQP